jgi:hypothetical protein
MKKLKNIYSIEEFLNEASMNNDPSVKMDHYMFFENLKTIKQSIEELMSLDPMMVDDTLQNGHDWAADHMSTAKESIDQVTHFFMNKK